MASTKKSKQKYRKLENKTTLIHKKKAAHRAAFRLNKSIIHNG